MFAMTTGEKVETIYERGGGNFGDKIALPNDTALSLWRIDCDGRSFVVRDVLMGDRYGYGVKLLGGNVEAFSGELEDAVECLLAEIASCPSFH